MDVQSVRDAVPSPLVGERLQLHSSEEHTNDGTVRDAVVDIVTQDAMNSRYGLCQDRFWWHAIDPACGVK
jgi:hypothetical protein